MAQTYQDYLYRFKFEHLETKNDKLSWFLSFWLSCRLEMTKPVASTINISWLSTDNWLTISITDTCGLYYKRLWS